jgi:hypothetical protein
MGGRVKHEVSCAQTGTSPPGVPVEYSLHLVAVAVLCLQAFMLDMAAATGLQCRCHIMKGPDAPEL